MRRGKLFVLSSPSGGGKTTLALRVLKADPELVRSVSMTTRKPRKGEVHGVDYFFVSEGVFRGRIRRKGFLEHANVFDCLYGTPRDFVERQRRSGKDVLLVVDVQGAAQIQKRDKSAILVFVMPPSKQELMNRLKKRSTDAPGEIRKRLKMAEQEMKQARLYDHVVINKDLHKATADLKKIIRIERDEKQAKASG